MKEIREILELLARAETSVIAEEVDMSDDGVRRYVNGLLAPAVYWGVVKTDDDGVWRLVD